MIIDTNILLGEAKPGTSLIKTKKKVKSVQSKSINTGKKLSKDFDWIRNEVYKYNIAKNVNSKVNPNIKTYPVMKSNVSTDEFNINLKNLRVKYPNRTIKFDSQNVNESELDFLNALIDGLMTDEPELYNWIIQNKFDLVGYLRSVGIENLQSMKAKDVYISIAKNMNYPKSNDIESKYNSGFTSLFSSFDVGKFFTDNWIWILAGAGVIVLITLMKK